MTLATTPPVSKELQKILDRVAGMAANRKDEVFDLVQQDESMPTDVCTCTWWDGCYYCKDEDGLWHSVRCVT
ncbi:gsr2462 [Gloeobacter violaceus PCC 7421]|uniref:Gsr2462 protein n=1 Tax=Gloeobacter violaceus (strain ATCC 29082 / PCC 7421) TaxID=251221 RepID=Q7NHS3_GLOVI|nr:gsr2462 [Gloeobacter violaceus PCC 7421]